MDLEIFIDKKIILIQYIYIYIYIFYYKLFYPPYFQLLHAKVKSIHDNFRVGSCPPHCQEILKSESCQN